MTASENPQDGLETSSPQNTQYPAMSLPSAQELVGLIESLIQGEIELKFAYFLADFETERQTRAEKHLAVLRDELVRKLTERIDMVATNRGLK